MYCEKCRRVFEGDRCPECRKSRCREATAEDPCYLTEQGQPWAGMLADVLKQHEIPFLTSGRLGAGLAVRVGSMLESERFYVRFSDLARAGDIVDELFGEGSPR